MPQLSTPRTVQQDETLRPILIVSLLGLIVGAALGNTDLLCIFLTVAWIVICVILIQLGLLLFLGLLVSGGGSSLAWAEFAVKVLLVTLFIYCAVVTFIILKVIDIIVGLRVSPEVEVEGLDINLHGETVHG